MFRNLIPYAAIEQGAKLPRISTSTTLSVLFLGLATLVGCEGTPPPKPCAATDGEPLSVVLVMIDTVRADHLSHHGYRKPTSPNLARLADEGATFMQAIAASPWTGPSVASVVTGLYPDEMGVHKFFATYLAEEFTTLAELLSEAGFATGAIVANGVVGPKFGHDQGYEAFYGGNTGEVYNADWVTDQALAWIGETDSPFFAYVHYLDPHEPYLAPAEWRARFVEPTEQFEERLLEDRRFISLSFLPRQLAALENYYDAEIAFTDHELGRLVEGLPPNVLVIVTGDHGEEFQDHGGYLHGHTLFDELLRVPLVIRGPGVCAGNYPEAVSHTDIMPTLLELLGQPVPEGLAGHSLAPTLRGERPPNADRVLLSVRGWEDTTWIAARQGPWKLVYNSESDQTTLFHVGGDPEELLDRSADERRVVGRLRRAITKRSHRVREAPAPDSDEMQEERMRHLRALGYVN